MNRFLLLVLIAGATFLIVLFAVKPELIENIWMWIIGLAGAIVRAFQMLIDYFKKKFSDSSEDDEKDETSESSMSEKSKNETSVEEFNGIDLSLLRFSDNGETTIGLLYINDKFYCYTLEDTFREEKIAGETRISSGTYQIQFRKDKTELTLKYRERYPEWFNWHLQLMDVPGFNSIYIHNGGDHTHTEGCILVSDSLNVSNETSFLSNSRETFRKLYGYLFEQLENNIPVRINIYDENRITKIN
ncbi:MAG: DUF5675 family protein [Bacteroidota bacterium]|nr:DUF5675 family protein [Bacteroidota bacterium]